MPAERERDGKNWKIFELNTVFPIIQRGKRLKTADHTEGDVPYVSSSAVNNGVDNFISNRIGVRVYDDCITIANSGSVGQAFYHPYRFVASDHVTELKNEKLNGAIYLFMLPIISRLSEKYNFNHEINDARMRREKIILPADNSGSPDWSYMEQQGKILQAQQVCAYLDYLENRVRGK